MVANACVEVLVIITSRKTPFDVKRFPIPRLIYRQLHLHDHIYIYIYIYIIIIILNADIFIQVIIS